MNWLNINYYIGLCEDVVHHVIVVGDQYIFLEYNKIFFKSDYYHEGITIKSHSNQDIILPLSHNEFYSA